MKSVDDNAELPEYPPVTQSVEFLITTLAAFFLLDDILPNRTALFAVTLYKDVSRYGRLTHTDFR